MRHDPKLHKNMDHRLKIAYLRKQKEIKVIRDHEETLMSRRQSRLKKRNKYI